ncbi:hypothetical protein JVU11DRAFT_3829 [Chiua virens]|nr:hypothetical protein JVU11DRAFT_3829 [Chiua virens]
MFFAYMHRFNVSSGADFASGLHSLKRATRRDGSHLGDMIPLDCIHSPTHIIPQFGKEANSHLTVHNSYKLCTDFWLNKYWNKQAYYSLTL